MSPPVPTTPAPGRCRPTHQEPQQPQHEHSQCDPPENLHCETDAEKNQYQKQHEQDGNHNLNLLHSEFPGICLSDVLSAQHFSVQHPDPPVALPAPAPPGLRD